MRGRRESSPQFLFASLRRPLLIAVGLAVLSQVTGINTILYYGSLIFTEQAGQRASAALMGLALATLAAVFHSRSGGPATLLLLILAYVAAFAISLGPGAWLLISELFPTRVRGRAAGIATIALWTACLAVTFTFLSLVSWIGAAGAFWLYASLCAVAVVFIWRFTPETKGRTLEQIERSWRRSV